MQNSFKVGKIKFSRFGKPVVIAEIGINHGGSLSEAIKLSKSAIKAGATIIKHQTHIPEDEMSYHAKKIIPDFNYLEDHLPKIDILVVPSAEHHLDTDLENENLINFVKKVAIDAQYITSHCDGAFILAKAGLLNGKVSTTFPSDIDKMRVMFPDLDIRKEVLFVHDGKYITSAGGAKSFEAALYLCEYLYGKEIAKKLAEGLVIDWNIDKVPHLKVK